MGALADLSRVIVERLAVYKVIVSAVVCGFGRGA